MSFFSRQTRRPVSPRPRKARPRLEPLEERLALTAGALDTSFGGAGFAQTAIGPILDGAPHAVAVQPDGKTVASAYDGYGCFALVRYKVDGSLDSTFGTKGKATISFGMSSYLWDLAIQPDGKIVAVGEGLQGSFGNYQGYNALVRLNANGSLDTTFGDPGTGTKRTGKVLTPVPPGSSDSWSVALQTDGKVVVGATRSGDFGVYRYTTAGKLDTTFNGTGYVTTDFGGGTSWDSVSGVAVQPDGKIVAAGRAGVIRTQSGGDEADFGIVRYNTNGTLDATFGVGGKSQVNLSGTGIGDAAQSVDIQPLPTGSFRIVASGYSVTADNTYVMTVAAVTPGGSLDPTFGAGGVVKTPSFQLSSGLSGTLSYGNSLRVQPDGRVVVGVTGRTPNLAGTGGFGLVRYTADGAIDTSFADNGISFRDKWNGKPIRLSRIALAADGRIAVAGQINTNAAATNSNDLLVARYLR